MEIHKRIFSGLRILASPQERAHDKVQWQRVVAHHLHDGRNKGELLRATGFQAPFEVPFEVGNIGIDGLPLDRVLTYECGGDAATKKQYEQDMFHGRTQWP